MNQFRLGELFLIKINGFKEKKKGGGESVASKGLLTHDREIGIDLYI